jgi:aryl-alcohol dehydrogenase-like predicted oxidoreductase
VDARRLGRTHIDTSPIGLVCWQLSQGKGRRGACRRSSSRGRRTGSWPLRTSASNQVRVNLPDRSIESNGVLDLALKRHVTLIAHSPSASGW